MRACWQLVVVVVSCVTRVLVVSVATGNNIGNEGAKALGPHLAKLSNMTALHLICSCSVVGVCGG